MQGGRPGERGGVLDALADLVQVRVRIPGVRLGDLLALLEHQRDVPPLPCGEHPRRVVADRPGALDQRVQERGRRPHLRRPYLAQRPGPEQLGQHRGRVHGLAGVGEPHDGLEHELVRRGGEVLGAEDGRRFGRRVGGAEHRAEHGPLGGGRGLGGRVRGLVPVIDGLERGPHVRVSACARCRPSRLQFAGRCRAMAAMAASGSRPSARAVAAACSAAP